MKCPLQGRAGQGAILAALLALTCQPVHPALADPTICVSCDGPTVVYSCSMAPGPDGGRPAASRRALQFACIEDVARHYGHASCSVKRNDVGSCNGVVHMVSTAPAVQGNEAVKREGAAAVPPAEARRRRSSEPKTVIEMAERTVDDTKKQIDRSARSVSKAARSTWRCVASLFQKC
jgi:hypothetical protein